MGPLITLTVLTESSGVLSLPVILLKTFDHNSEGVDSSYVFGPSGQSSLYLHMDSYPTELSFPTLRRQINGLKKHSEDEKTDSLKGNKCNAIIPVAACLSVLWTLEKNRGTSQQGGCGHTLDYPLILHPLRYPQMGASLWTRLG